MDSQKIRDAFSDFNEKIADNKKAISMIAIIAVLIIALAVSTSVGLLPAWISPKFAIESDATSLEVGETTELKAVTSFSPEKYHFEWSTSNPDAGDLKGEGSQITFVAKEPGQTTITLKVNGRAVKQAMTVFTKAYIDIVLSDPWLYVGNYYDYELLYPADSVNITDVYVEDEYHQRLSDDLFFQEAYGAKKLFISEKVDPGNYELIVKGVAQSDGRTLKTSTPFTALTQIQKGYYQFSISNENLLSIEPWHYSAIENFLDKELDIDIDLATVKTKGTPVGVTSFRSKYVFYRDPTRADTLCYEMDVGTSGSASDKKTFEKITTRSRDGSTWSIATDGILFLIYPEGYQFEYYMEDQHSGTTTNTGTSNSGTTNTGTSNSGTNYANTAPGNNNPSQGNTNIPSPPPPI